MKKLILTSLLFCAIATVSFAQTPMTKEEKQAAKAKKEADLTTALTETGLTADQQTLVKATLTEAEQKNKEIKNNDALSDAEKVAKKEEVDAAKNEKLKQIMGADKYKVFSAIRKKLKEGTPAPASN